jgi:hypothetical protein
VGSLRRCRLGQTFPSRTMLFWIHLLPTSHECTVECYRYGPTILHALHHLWTTEATCLSMRCAYTDPPVTGLDRLYAIAHRHTETQPRQSDPRLSLPSRPPCIPPHSQRQIPLPTRTGSRTGGHTAVSRHVSRALDRDCPANVRQQGRPVCATRPSSEPKPRLRHPALPRVR